MRAEGTGTWAPVPDTSLPRSLGSHWRATVSFCYVAPGAGFGVSSRHVRIASRNVYVLFTLCSLAVRIESVVK